MEKSSVLLENKKSHDGTLYSFLKWMNFNIVRSIPLTTQFLPEEIHQLNFSPEAQKKNIENLFYERKSCFYDNPLIHRKPSNKNIHLLKTMIKSYAYPKNLIEIHG